MNEASDTLLPCPFCGGGGFWQSEHDSDGFGVFLAIRCADCGSCTQQHYVSHGSDCPEFRAEVRASWNARAAVPAVQPIVDWQEDSNAHCREHDANALCATCGKTWGNHIGRCCDGDESSPRRFKLAAPPQSVRDLIEQLCSAAVAYGERADGEQAYYAAKAKLIEATSGALLRQAKEAMEAGLRQFVPDSSPVRTQEQQDAAAQMRAALAALSAALGEQP